MGFSALKSSQLPLAMKMLLIVILGAQCPSHHSADQLYKSVNNKKETEKLVAVTEQRAKAVVYNRAVMDEQLLKTYRSRGYLVQEKGYSVIMCKPLKAESSFTQVYGDKFFLTRLDSF